MLEIKNKKFIFKCVYIYGINYAGQADLLMKERFKQFRGLIKNCEFNTGEQKTTIQDLQGFWDIVYFQVII